MKKSVHFFANRLLCLGFVIVMPLLISACTGKFTSKTSSSVYHTADSSEEHASNISQIMSTDNSPTANSQEQNTTGTNIANKDITNKNKSNSSKESSTNSTLSNGNHSSNSTLPNNNHSSSNAVSSQPTAHVHSFGNWKTTKEASCTSTGMQERVCSCGKKETKTTQKTAHSFNKGKCTVCDTPDPNYKTPNLILGDYILQNGTKQANGKYMVSSNNTNSTTYIYWNPIDHSLLFAEESTSSVGVVTAGIIYEYGANQQKITVINNQTATGKKITGIGYIYIDTYSLYNETIYSYSCDTSASLMPSSKKLAETSINILVAHIDDFLWKNVDLRIKDFGFTSW